MTAPPEGSTPLPQRSKWSDPNIILSIVMVLVLLLQAVILGYQATILRGQRQEMKKQREEMTAAGQQTDRIIAEDKRLANASETSAQEVHNSVMEARRGIDMSLKQSRQSLRQSEKALDRTIEMSRNDQRAWVGPRDEPTVPEIKEGSTLKGSVVFVNSGKSPAKNCTWIYRYQIIPAGEPLEPSYPWEALGGDAKEQSSRGTVANLEPGATMRLSVFSSPLLKTSAEGIGSHTSILYLFGRVTYDDAFGEGHWRHFAYEFVAPESHWYAYKQYNDSD